MDPEVGEHAAGGLEEVGEGGAAAAEEAGQAATRWRGRSGQWEPRQQVRTQILRDKSNYVVGFVKCCFVS